MEDLTSLKNKRHRKRDNITAMRRKKLNFNLWLVRFFIRKKKNVVVYKKNLVQFASTNQTKILKKKKKNRHYTKAFL